MYVLNHSGEAITHGHSAPHTSLVVLRRRNTVGRLRLGLSAGSDRNEMIGGVHAGYEHNYRLKNGVIIYWQAKTDLMINCRDLFRTGIAIGIKLPIG